METKNELQSKILILDIDEVYRSSLQNFCEHLNLIGVRPNKRSTSQVVKVLQSNVDFGGIFVSENYMGDVPKTMDLVTEIRALRPELPIFLRRERIDTMAGISVATASMFRGAFTLEDLNSLRSALDSSVFSRVYPNALARGVVEMTLAALRSIFPDCDTQATSPYLVSDRIIYGEVFTLISLETDWCRGYMTMQSLESALVDLFPKNPDGTSAHFRELNFHLGELTNLVWGSFKNRYPNTGTKSNTQVPIIINHHRRYISFGADDAQLCIKYILQRRDDPHAQPVTIYQRFIFNLNWSPEDFKENATIESLVQSGDLELF